MSDPWQDEAEVEDDWDEELAGPPPGSLFDPEELDEDDDPDLFGDDPDDTAA
jgi:hypothetical protein